jgi:protein TonB
MATVAEPSPAIAFALPVQAPATVADHKQAAPVVVETRVEPTPVPQVQTLTHGYGEGKQPAPIYPARAMREGQEGTVRVRFSVGENGRVMSVEASAPSPWELLNHEAMRVVRERWRFRPGPIRLYEVPIRFVLQK